jgi:hypothetical protein
MATSVYFNNYNSIAEQRVVEDLIVESIKIMGFDAYYLPIFNSEDRDILYGEDPVKKFKQAFPVEFYLSSALEYTGEKEFFSKFGLEIKNSANVLISKRSFSQRVPQQHFTRPREGDLIYVPFLNGTGELYEIRFVDQTKDFFTLGRRIPYFYELQLEKFKYSQEVIDTGVADIDDAVAQSGYTIDLNVADGADSFEQKEIVFQSDDLQYANATTVAVVQKWINHANGTGVLSVTNIAGEFVDGQPIVGLTSGANWVLSNYNHLLDSTRNETYDNLYIEEQGTNIVDMSESNPFGTI